MKRISLALAFSLIGVLTLLPVPTWASHRHRAFAGCCVFISPGPSFVFRHGFTHPHFGPTFIVVDPAPQPVWVPGSWQWTGVQWVWLPGQWVFPGQRLLLRNPCD